MRAIGIVLAGGNSKRMRNYPIKEQWLLCRLQEATAVLTLH